MKLLRPLLLAILLVAAFYVLTTYPNGLLRPSTVTRPSHVELKEASAAPAFDSEEQENIAVYKKALPSVVNITSTAVAYDFFYGAVPKEGQGSGFVIDPAGHILTNYHVGEGSRWGEGMTSENKKYRGVIVGTDPQQDLAGNQIFRQVPTPSAR